MSRILIKFALGLICVCLLFDGTLQLPYIREIIKTSLVEVLQKESGYQIEIGTLSLSPFLTIKGESITLKENEETLIAAKVGIFTINPWKLLFKKELHLPSFFLEETKLRDGKNKLPKEIRGSFRYVEGKGHLRIQGIAELYFDTKTHVGKLDASWEAFSLNGSFSWLSDGTLTSSKSTLKIGESLASCQLYGNLFSHDMTLLIEGKKFSWGEIILEEPSLQLSMREGAGKVELTFRKEKEKHHFSGQIAWQDKPSLQFQTNLSQIVRLLSWDLPQARGDLFLEVKASEKGCTLHGELKNGVFESFELGTVFSSGHAIIEGDQKKLRLKKLKAQDDEGGLYKGSGSLALDFKKRLPFTLQVSMQKGVFFHSDYAQMAFDGELSFIGNLDKALLKGDLRADSAHITLPKKLPTPVDMVEVTYINLAKNEPEPAKPIKRFAGWPLSLDITLSILENGIVKGKNLHSVWRGKTEIGGTLTKPLAKGEFKLQSGNYLFRGKSCELKEGTISLAGDPEKQTTLYLLTQLELENATIHATVKGPLLNTSIVLQSTPPMSQRAILAMILFNKKIENISSLEETQLTRSLKSLTENGDEKPDLLTRVAKMLRVDQIEIEEDSTREQGEVSVRVGKHLSDNTYISISSGLTSRIKGKSENGEKKENEKMGGSLRLEQKFGRRVKFRAEADSQSNGRFNLLWSKDY